MKFIIVLLASLSTIYASDFSLGNAYFSALDDAKMKLDEDSIEAFSAETTDTMIKVKVAGKSTNLNKVLTYSCSSDSCLSSNQNFLEKELNSLSDFMSVHKLALSKFEATLRQRKLELSSIIFVKSWKTVGGQDHFSQKFDYWTRFDFNQNNMLRTVYVQCHEHGDGNLACHYLQSGNNEPNL